MSVLAPKVYKHDLEDSVAGTLYEEFNAFDFWISIIYDALCHSDYKIIRFNMTHVIFDLLGRFLYIECLCK